MAVPKFYLEPRPVQKIKQANTSKDTTDKIVQAINMFYSFAGKRLQYYTGIRVDVKHFRPECNSSTTIKPIKSTAPYAAQNNEKLQAIADDAVTIVKKATGGNLNVKYVREQLDLIHKPKETTPDPTTEFKHNFLSYFNQAIEDSKTGRRVISTGNNKGDRYSVSSIKNYTKTLQAIKRYLEYRMVSNLEFEDINKDFYDDFMFYCYDVESKEKSTFGNFIKDIKTIMKEASIDSFSSKDFVKPGYESDTIYLRSDQIDEIAKLDLSDSTKVYTHKGDKGQITISYETLNDVRNLFLIGAYTGLRFSDFSTLEPQSFNGNFIKVKQVKTGNRITIPIMEKLKPVLAKYPHELPTISNLKFNDYIKYVAKLAGLTEQYKIKDTKGNKPNETKKPLYLLITSHCCRRSYATNMFKAGVPPMLIMSATGHKTESSFLKYIRATNEDKANLLAEAFTKLGL